VVQATAGLDGRYFETRSASVLMVLWLLLAFSACFFLVSVGALLLDIAIKWQVIGLRKSGLYCWDESDYCQRWQLYLLSQESRRVMKTLDRRRGTQYLVHYFRALGGHIGDKVCLYPNGGDPMMVEPELVTLGDGVCVDDASLIAHLNTKGQFSLNEIHVAANVTLRCGSRLLSGGRMNEHSVLLEHTLMLGGDTAEAGSVPL
jgi:hypothetical protein